MVNKKGNSLSHFKNIRTRLKCKRSQISIFIIIAILLVVAVGIIFLARNSLKPEPIIPPVGVENIGDFVTNCLKLTSENGIIFIGRQGGYYIVPSPNMPYTGNDSGPQPPISPQNYFTELGSIVVPYYWDGNSLVNMPSNLTIIESQLSLYVQGNLDNCLNNFTIFKQKGFNVEKGVINASVRILDEKVIVSLDYPVTIKKEEVIQQKTDYNVDVPARLGLIFTLTQNMIRDHVAYPPVYLINNQPKLRDDAFRTIMYRNFYKSFLDIRPDNTAILIITDSEYKLNNTYYDFIFAYKY